MLKKDRPWNWGPEQQKTFNTLKQKMQKTPILAHPNYNQLFVLYTDASYAGLGFVLSQIRPDGFEHPIQYEERKLLPAEANYTQCC